jgi:hypothetical protein
VRQRSKPFLGTEHWFFSDCCHGLIFRLPLRSEPGIKNPPLIGQRRVASKIFLRFYAFRFPAVDRRSPSSVAIILSHQRIDGRCWIADTAKNISWKIPWKKFLPDQAQFWQTGTIAIVKLLEPVLTGPVFHSF